MKYARRAGWQAHWVRNGHPEHMWQKRFYDFRVWSGNKGVEKLPSVRCNPWGCLGVSHLAEFHLPDNNPNTPTPLVVPTYTFPLTIMGVMNLLPAPKLSRPLAAWVVL